MGVHVGFAAGALWLFGVPSTGAALLASPLILLAALYGYGRPVPVRRAKQLLIGLPLVTALASGGYPGWRVLTRPRTVDTSMQRIPGGCEHLVADGTALASLAQGVWRLPTVDEAVRTMAWRGRNAGGKWDAASRRPSYRVTPDKEAPL